MEARINKIEKYDGIYHMPDGTPHGSVWKDVWYVTVAFDSKEKAEELKQMIEGIPTN